MQFSKLLIILAVLWLASGCDKLFNSDDETPAPVNPTVELLVESAVTSIGASQMISAEVTGVDTAGITTEWAVTGGEFVKTGNLQIEWTAPDDTVQVAVSVVVKTTDGGSSTEETLISVGNAPPEISDFAASAAFVLAGNEIALTATAADPESYPLSYRFWVTPDSGMLQHSSPDAPTATWTAPEGGNYSGEFFRFVVEATDNLDFFTRDTLEVLAYSDFASVWMVDSGTRKLIKYTANGIKILESAAAFQKPVAVSNDVEDSFGCYVADYAAGTVFKMDATGTVIASFGSIPTVIDLALHEDTRTLWALSVGGNSVTVIDGFTDEVVKTIYGFRQPRWLAINQATGDVWISEQGNNRLVCLNARTSIASLPDTISYQNAEIFPDSVETTYLNSPIIPFVRSEIAQPLYLADRDDRQIERFDWNGTQYVRNASPISLLSALPRSVVVTSVGGLFNVVLTVSFDGKLFAFAEGNPASLTQISGDYAFQAPHAVAVDEATGQLWIGDNGTNQLVKIRINSDFSFTTLHKLNGFVFIEDAVINK